MGTQNKKAAVTEATPSPEPQWKTELLELMDKQTVVPLVDQLKEGVITEDVLLFLNLGIPTERVQALALRFNKIIKKHSSKTKPKFVSTNELTECEKLSDLIKLVGSRM
jgi:hypothetical protein